VSLEHTLGDFFDEDPEPSSSEDEQSKQERKKRAHPLIINLANTYALHLGGRRGRPPNPAECN
jgi:hypothetical protein